VAIETPGCDALMSYLAAKTRLRRKRKLTAEWRSLVGRPAVLSLESWAGTLRKRVEIIGETPRRYRIRVVDGYRVRGRRSFSPGDVTLVPRWAISVNEPP